MDAEVVHAVQGAVFIPFHQAVAAELFFECLQAGRVGHTPGHLAHAYGAADRRTRRVGHVGAQDANLRAVGSAEQQVFRVAAGNCGEAPVVGEAAGFVEVHDPEG